MIDPVSPDRSVVFPEDVAPVDFYRLVNSCVLPRPIAWVSSKSADGVLNLAPYSLFTSVSSEPPMLAFSSTRRMKDSSNNAKETGEFIINVGVSSQLDAINVSSESFDSSVDEFEVAGLTPEPSTKLSVPRVKEAPISFECKTYDVQEIGNSFLVIGEVVAISVRSDLIGDKGMIDPRRFGSVAKLGGPFWAVDPQIVVAPRPDDVKGNPNA